MDDASIIAPDNWSGRNAYIPKKWGHDNGIITFPPRKQFYCTVHRVEIALISSDMYFTTGVRFMLEDIKYMILHVYKDHGELYRAPSKKFDLVIFSASDAKDISEIYRTILRLRLTKNNTFIIVVANDNVRHVLASIARRYYGVKVLNSREKNSVIKQEIMRLLTGHEEKKENKHFPATLTPRQTDILFMAADGISTEAIANHLGVSTSTIYATKARSLDKAGATSKALEAILYAQISDNILQTDKLHHDRTMNSTPRYNNVY